MGPRARGAGLLAAAGAAAAAAAAAVVLGGVTGWGGAGRSEGESVWAGARVRDAAGHAVAPGELEGRVVLAVNVASQCGLTSTQYPGLVALHEKFAPDLEVLAFPCNQFGAQEPGSSEDVAEFARREHGANFRVMEKVTVNGGSGEGADELWDRLKDAAGSHPLTGPFVGGDVAWNFEKILVDRKGRVRGRFLPTTPPVLLERAVKALVAEGGSEGVPGGVPWADGAERAPS